MSMQQQDAGQVSFTYSIACLPHGYAEHQVDDLEFELHQGLLEDFNTEIEDGSTMQVSIGAEDFL